LDSCRAGETQHREARGRQAARAEECREGRGVGIESGLWRHAEAVQGAAVAAGGSGEARAGPRRRGGEWSTPAVYASFAPGKIIAKSDDGKGVGGSCNDGDKIKIVLDSGVYIIKPQ
jgi:hypothetical protein